MKKIFNAVDKITRVEGWISMILIVFSLVYMILYVIFRVCDSPFRGANEVIEMTMCMLAFAAFAFTQIKRRHVQVGFVIVKLPIKVRFVLSVFNCLWCTVLTGLLTYACWAQGDYAVRANKTSAVLQFPYSPFYYACAVLMALFTITFLCDTIKSVMALAGNKEMQEDIAKGWI